MSARSAMSDRPEGRLRDGGGACGAAPREDGAGARGGGGPGRGRPAGGGRAGAVRGGAALAAGYRRSSLRDDALWRAAHLLREHGDAAGALARLRLLLATRRRALITGSYNSEWLDDAQLLVGRIQLD